MKRFYTSASIRTADDGYEILLDQRPIKTPARNLLRVPGERLAQAIAAEWEAQGEDIAPRAMPLTGLANAAVDRVAPDPESFAAGLSLYGESDLLCYRAEGPGPLVQRQSELWDPLLAWARQRFGVDFETVCGIIHRAQPSETLEKLRRAVAARGAFELAGLSPLVTISGSLLIALALAEDAISLDAAWTAANLDEAWQAEQWGEDCEAAVVRKARLQDFEAACRFLELL
jgi:chaperone required for assembly of F1-ATPase